MAPRKTTQKTAEEAQASEEASKEPVAEEVTEKGQEPTQEATEKEPETDQGAGDSQEPVNEPKEAGKMVLVRNKARFDYTQPSTGVRIHVNSREPTKVLNDGWVEAFVDAGLLEYA